MTKVKTINANTLRNWLELGQPVNVLDIRPMNERSEWFIPQSLHFNAYDKLKNNNFEAFNGLHLDKSVPVVTFCADDTLFTNGVGRPDLKADTEGVKEKSKLLFQSLQKLLVFDDDIIIMPSHTSQPVEFDNISIKTTLGKVKSIAMLQMGEVEFIEPILNRIPPTPANYLSIVEKNIKGHFSDINPIDLEAGANRCAIS